MTRRRVRVWDLPLRLFHWSWAGAFAAAWLLRGDRTLYWHLLAGYLFGGLLLFRLVWGFTGTRWARFSAMTPRPAEVLAHLRALAEGRPPHHPGHNPAGSLAIHAMLGLGALLAITGLLTLGAEEQQGPLAGVAGFAWGVEFRRLHELAAWTLLGLAGIHVAGVIAESLLQRENLPLAMITGRKVATRPLLEVPRRGGVALLLAGLAALFAGYWSQPWLAATDEHPFLPFPGPQLSRPALWEEECGGCHPAYHPSLLPPRSWQRLLQEQADHFGEDLALDADTLGQLERQAQALSSVPPPTEAAWKLRASIPPDAIPLRISATDYWRRKHAGLDEAVWSRTGRAGCDACHLDAAQGWFADGAIRLPPSATPSPPQGGST